MRKDWRTDIGRFLGLDQTISGAGRHTCNPNGKWDRVADDMMLIFIESGHLVFRSSSALERRDLKSKGKGHFSFHICGDKKSVEVALRTIIYVNQLSIHGAVADMCDELACRISDCSERTGKLVAQDNPETTVIPTEYDDNEQNASDR